MTSRLAMLVAAGLSLTLPALAQQQPGRGQAPAELVQLAQEFRAARRAFSEQGDFSAKAAAAQATQLAAFRARLEKLPRAGWPVADQVDWYVLRTELNQLEYDQRIRKAPSRDPGFYVQQAIGAVPPDINRVSAEQAAAIAARLAKVPALFDQAKRNLTEASRTHGELALRDIEDVRGVRVQQSGLERLQSLAKASAARYPDVAKAADGAGRALTEFASWIRTNAPS